jgi:hypothetical protein
MVVPSIEGTYKLIKRELPDGTIQQPPVVNGMCTFTKEYRNFSVVWKDDKDLFYSEAYVARYTLTDKEYIETSEYLIVSDQIGGKEISYDLSNTTATAPVSFDGERIKFDLPQPFEKVLFITVEFAGDKLKAAGKGMFIDYWEKIL